MNISDRIYKKILCSKIFYYLHKINKSHNVFTITNKNNDFIYFYTYEKNNKDWRLIYNINKESKLYGKHNLRCVIPHSITELTTKEIQRLYFYMNEFLEISIKIEIIGKYYENKEYKMWRK